MPNQVRKLRKFQGLGVWIFSGTTYSIFVIFGKMFYPNLQSFVWRRNVVVILALKYGGQKATDTESVFEFSYRREYIL